MQIKWWFSVARYECGMGLEGDSGEMATGAVAADPRRGHLLRTLAGRVNRARRLVAFAPDGKTLTGTSMYRTTSITRRNRLRISWERNVDSADPSGWLRSISSRFRLPSVGTLRLSMGRRSPSCASAMKTKSYPCSFPSPLARAGRALVLLSSSPAARSNPTRDP